MAKSMPISKSNVSGEGRSSLLSSTSHAKRPSQVAEPPPTAHYYPTSPDDDKVVSRQQSLLVMSPTPFTTEQQQASFYTETEVALHNNATSSWAIHDGKVYDLTHYIKDGQHPGGNTVLKEYAGTDLTKAFLDVGHSASAYHLLDSFFIGYLERRNNSGQQQQQQQQLETQTGAAADGFVCVPPLHHNGTYNIGTLDFSKPLVSQIFHLTKQEYVDLSVQFFCSTAVCKFFSSPYLEIFSRTAWWIIPALWLPIAGFIFFKTIEIYHLSMSSAIVYWISGIFIWTLAEYLIHRFVFHVSEECLPDSRFVRVFHFLAHGVHHILPMDPMRLVMPPLLLFIFMTPFYFLAISIFPLWLVRAIWPGVLTGYVCYDMIHYSSHHFPVEHLPFLSFMKRYHMKHHFKEPSKAFGVSNPLWDYIFGTELMLLLHEDLSDNKDNKKFYKDNK